MYRPWAVGLNLGLFSSFSVKIQLLSLRIDLMLKFKFFNIVSRFKWVYLIFKSLHILVVSLLQLLNHWFGLQAHLSFLFLLLIANIGNWDNFLLFRARILWYLNEFRFSMEFLRGNINRCCVFWSANRLSDHR